jgi:hypothetical protein
VSSGLTTLGDKVSPSPAALELQQGLPFEDWCDVGRRIVSLNQASTWWLADWLFFGQWEYGSKYSKAAEITGLDEGTLRNYSSIAGAFEASRRRDKLSVGHHALVASLPEVEQEVWLARAEAEGWSVRQLQAELRQPAAIATSTSAPTLRIRVAAELQSELVGHWVECEAFMLEPRSDGTHELVVRRGNVVSTADNGATPGTSVGARSD